MTNRERIIDNNWQWFTDYAFLYTKWTVNCEKNRTCEIATGISIGGKPRGSKFKFTTHKEFKTYGAGAIKIRVSDGKGVCKVRIDEGEVGLITIYKDKN